MKKKIVALFIAILMLNATTLFTNAETIPELTPVHMLGDVDNDGQITANDYICLKRIYFGTMSIESLDSQFSAFYRCDINQNGEIDADDYILMKRAYFGTVELGALDIQNLGANYHLNYSIDYYQKDEISIEPRFVYWKNGMLVAQCYVINGYDHTVYNINVTSFTIGDINKNFVYASAPNGFGILNGLVLPSNTYTLWTFYFEPDDVVHYDGILRNIAWEYNCTKDPK